jgi:hypothetical protein
MAITPEEIEAVVAAIDARLGDRVATLVTERMGDIHQTLEQLRDEFTQTVGVLEGNDTILLSEIRRVGQPESQLVAGEAWTRFVRQEATALGLVFMAPKGEG